MYCERLCKNLTLTWLIAFKYCNSISNETFKTLWRGLFMHRVHLIADYKATTKKLINFQQEILRNSS